MREIREVIITIKNEAGGGGSPIPPAPDPDTPNETGDEKTENNGGIGAVSAILVTQAFSSAKSAAISVAKYEVNKYFSLRDDYVNQQNLSNALNCIGRGMTVATATLAGAKIGMAAGPIGAAIGAVVGFTASFVPMAIGAGQAVDRQSIAIATSVAYQDFAMSRRGRALTDGSIGSDL